MSPAIVTGTAVGGERDEGEWVAREGGVAPLSALILAGRDGQSLGGWGQRKVCRSVRVEGVGRGGVRGSARLRSGAPSAMLEEAQS